MIAAWSPSKRRNRSKMRRMLALLAAIFASSSSCRPSSLPLGSPTLVVPPPIRTIGRWPVCCRWRSIMMETRLPTWSDGAVQS